MRMTYLEGLEMARSFIPRDLLDGGYKTYLYVVPRSIPIMGPLISTSSFGASSALTHESADSASIPRPNFMMMIFFRNS
jgi:hypothetical protein